MGYLKLPGACRVFFFVKILKNILAYVLTRICIVTYICIILKRTKKMATQKVLRYKKGQLAMFNGTVIKIHEQLGVTTSDFSLPHERFTAVSFQSKIGRRWSGPNSLLVVHNRMITPA